MGPFEEEEEGTGIASHVVKVEGEDPDTPGYLRGDRVRLGRQRCQWAFDAKKVRGHTSSRRTNSGLTVPPEDLKTRHLRHPQSKTEFLV